MAYTVEKDWVTVADLRAVVVIILRKDGTKRHRCGYVGVPETSEFFGATYSEQLGCISQKQADSSTIGNKSLLLALTATVGSDNEENSARRSLDILIECHGGLTFASSDAKRTTFPVNSELHWFGFDCAHYGDQDIEQQGQEFDLEGEVRSLEYCVRECESIAAQLVQLEGNSHG